MLLTVRSQRVDIEETSWTINLGCGVMNVHAIWWSAHWFPKVTDVTTIKFHNFRTPVVQAWVLYYNNPTIVVENGSHPKQSMNLSSQYMKKCHRVWNQLLYNQLINSREVHYLIPCSYPYLMNTINLEWCNSEIRMLSLRICVSNCLKFRTVYHSQRRRRLFNKRKLMMNKALCNLQEELTSRFKWMELSSKSRVMNG